MPAKKKAAKKKAARRTAKRKAAKKAPKKKVAKKKAPKKAARKVAKKKVKRQPNPAFMRPWNISMDLAEIVGDKPLPRTQVTKKVWDYIKRNSLQDKIEKTMINADEKLKKVFAGKGRVSMFEMTKLISKHLS